MSDDVEFTMTSETKAVELFPQLPRLAERLGVKPNEGEGRCWLEMNDGTKYDVFALVLAFLDRMDAAS